MGYLGRLVLGRFGIPGFPFHAGFLFGSGILFCLTRSYYLRRRPGRIGVIMPFPTPFQNSTLFLIPGFSTLLWKLFITLPSPLLLMDSACARLPLRGFIRPYVYV